MIKIIIAFYFVAAALFLGFWGLVIAVLIKWIVS